MDIDAQIARAKELIAKREEIDEQIAALFGGAPSPPKKTRRCKICDSDGHNAMTCPERPDKAPTT